ncbi:hypothetical protein [Bradyrhizobium elkanii]|uniref:hypothetical protein n=1 Tax=Bradyrhizobium elkanii TaxID=29448 RepID=UPI0020A193BE|nr:hypothetical protein [Bradyrhizobium elkanii]MCP1974281.1 hypothetical protein [Bradyrhizobium elkanii]
MSFARMSLRLLIGALAFSCFGQPVLAAKSKLPNATPGTQCAGQRALAGKLASQFEVRVDPGKANAVLDSIDVQIRLPSNTEGWKAGSASLALVVGISDNAIVEVDTDEDVVHEFLPYEPANYDNITDIFRDRRRVALVYDPSEPSNRRPTILRVRPLDTAPVLISWAATGGQAKGCPVEQLTAVSRATHQASRPSNERAEAKPATCRAAELVRESLKNAFKITVTAPAKLVVGDNISVEWSTSNAELEGFPTYIVLSLPDWIRAEGQNVLVVPKEVRSPAKIAFGGTQTRVFIPLHSPGAPKAGNLRIKPFRVGAFPIAYAVVQRADCSENVVSSVGNFQTEVLPGPPEVFVQNGFSLDRPQKIIVSSRNQRIEVFDGTYRVYDENNVLLFDRLGRSPNFSRTGRFVAAFADNSDAGERGKMELLDLVSGKPVNLELSGPIIGWAAQDSFLIEGTYHTAS